MGLKEVVVACWLHQEGGIKSDQNGIERSSTKKYQLVPSLDKIRPKWDWKWLLSYPHTQQDLSIKSDQNGIERYRWIVTAICYLCDKIRPKWDWKSGSVTCFSLIGAMIKSDQNGIERLSFETIRMQLTHQIKSDQNGIESFIILLSGILAFLI